MPVALLLINTPDGKWYCRDVHRGPSPAQRFGDPEAGATTS